jgi:signal transduction histidine kinase
MSSNSPDHLRVMRSAAWMWIVYLAALAVLDGFIYTSGPTTPVLWYHLINGIPALIFLGIAYSKWLENQPEHVTPWMILVISAAPILVNQLFDLRLPQAPLSNLEGMVLRQLPVLFIGLVLVAWHYRRLVMLLYSVGINVFELAIVFSLGHYKHEQPADFVFITIIRTVCFILVGVFINQLITHLRAQQESLRAANDQLAHYASTLESLTVSRERNRVSRELHDTVVHTMSGLSVQLETAKAYCRVDLATVENLLDQSLEATRSGLQETRRALKALRASPLEDLGLVGSIRQMSENAAERGRLLLDLVLPEHDLVLSPDVEQCIYRLAQEALENVVHHANARRLVVRLTQGEQDIALLVQDDGIGFDPEKASPSGHFGLAGIQERAQLVGGRVTITSRKDGGTTVQLMIKGRFA